MANFNDFDDTEFGQKFNDTFGNQPLVPLPATHMMKKGSPPGIPQLNQPFKFTQPVFHQGNQQLKFTQPQFGGEQPNGVGDPEPAAMPQFDPQQFMQQLMAALGGGGQPFAGGPGPQPLHPPFFGPQGPTSFAGGPGPQPGTLPPNLMPGLGAGGPGPQPQAGGQQSVEQMLQDLRNRFPNTPAGDLTLPGASQQAMGMWRDIVNAAGGNYDQLLSEIGPTRMLNRLRGALGRELPEGSMNEGAVPIGGGLHVPFGPGASESAGTRSAFGGGGIAGSPNFGGGFGSIVPGTGPGHPGVPAQFVGGSAGAQLAQLARTGGVNPGLMFEVEKSLRESAERTRTAEEGALMEGLASRRITGGGVEAHERGLLSERLAAGINTGLRDFGTAQALQGQQNQLAAAQSIAQHAMTARGQDISLLQSQMASALQQQSIDNNFALGQGGLAMQNLAADNNFILGMLGAQIDMGGFMLAYENALNGDVAGFLDFMTRIAEQMRLPTTVGGGG